MHNYFLDDNEKVLKRYKPNKFLYAIGPLRNPIMFIFMLIWTAVVVGILSHFIWGVQLFNEAAPGVFGWRFDLFTIMPFLFLMLPLYFFVIGPIYRLLKSIKVEYIITDKRVYIISGLIGTDVKSLEYREIDKLNVNVGLFEKLTNTGTVQLTPDRQYSRGDNTYTESGEKLVGIDEPYEAYKLIKKNMLDVVTDQQYPNDLRPKTNKGYNTELDNE